MRLQWKKIEDTLGIGKGFPTFKAQDTVATLLCSCVMGEGWRWQVHTSTMTAGGDAATESDAKTAAEQAYEDLLLQALSEFAPNVLDPTRLRRYRPGQE